MLSPEIFNFPAPESLFQVEKFEGKVPLNNQNINNFHYNHLVTIIIPDSAKLEQLNEKVTQDCSYYKILGLKLEDLVSLKFICGFIRSGKLSLLSIDRRIDCDTCFGLDPYGQLLVTVDKETYQSLGLEGSISHFTRKLKNHFTITVDLADEKLIKNTSRLSKLKTCLGRLEKCSVIVTWKPPNEDICPSSIAKYFSDLGYVVKQCTPNFRRHTVYSKVPDFDLGSIDVTNAKEFAEWLGFVSIDGDFQEDPSGYLSSYVVPSATGVAKKIDCLQWRGFFTATDIKEMIEQIIKTTNLANLPWISIYIQGFSDSPVSWTNEEQHYYTNGDNGYIIIFNKENGLFCIQKCSRKRYKDVNKYK
ncbi:unnamed protein product [Phaedon cochleariae]|uniref:Uncharacterized protein n=1 Tax=Phaedon cochleariae TaxID=80249 RepID=A0A9P0DX77_PHACE|nr:unnamed protein product [Phaedon cochleariae]